MTSSLSRLLLSTAVIGVGLALPAAAETGFDPLKAKAPTETAAPATVGSQRSGSSRPAL